MVYRRETEGNRDAIRPRRRRALLRALETFHADADEGALENRGQYGKNEN